DRRRNPEESTTINYLTTRDTSEESAGICRRCLESSNPWTEPLFRLGIPTIVVMTGPALLVVIAVLAVVLRVRSRGRRARRAGAEIRMRSNATTVRGYRVLVFPDGRASPFALPRRQGGIVVSTATLAALSGDELDAVLAHERAHLTQHHHVIAAISHELAHVFKPIPFISRSASTVPLYLEIAADNAARQITGARPLASALLKLIHHDANSAPSAAGDLALHAVGPNRIRTLLDSDEPAQGHRRTTIVAASLQNMTLVALTTAVALPWLIAMTSGCS
ncbi:M56 family metallopeptidase, partial [Gordonia humi]